MYFLTFLTKNLLRRRIRSILTASGVAVAVGTTVALLGISEGLSRTSMESFQKRGTDIVVLEKGVINQLDSDIDERLADQVQQMPEVRHLGRALISLTSFEAKGQTVPVVIQGWEPHSFLFDELEVQQGRRFRAGEPQVAMLGRTMAQNLNKKPGDSIEIEGETFQIVGVFSSFTGFENISVIVPLPELQRVSFREHRLTGFSLVLHDRAKAPETVAAVVERIDGLSLSNGTVGRLDAQPVEEHVHQTMHLKYVEFIAWMTSIIAMVVGTIGILNTMIMSVVERVKEISILRALGWKKSRVIQMIVGESLIISLIGSVLGILAAIGLNTWLTTLPAAADLVAPRIAPSVILQGVLLALAVGLVGGIYPGMRAAKLQPNEGLRHE